MNKRYIGLDFLKLVCSFLVICIHIPFPGYFGIAVMSLARIAVPIFFMITGFFYTSIVEQNRQKSQLRKIAQLVVVSNALYYVFGLSKQLLNYLIKKEEFSLAGGISLSSILKFVFLNQSPFSGHLWYLGALLYVLGIVFIWEELFRFSRRKLYPIIPLLLLVDLLFGKYSLLILGKEFPYILVRNFMFVGLPYFLIGDALSAKNISVQKNRLLLLSCFFGVTTLMARYLLGVNNLNAARDHYLSTTLMSVSIFLLYVNYGNETNNYLYEKACKAGRKYSLYIYIIHPMIIFFFSACISFLEKYVKWASSLYHVIAPIVVFGTSILLSKCIISLQMRFSKK